MINFEEQMKEHYAKLEMNMAIIENLFTNPKHKSYLGENVMLLDFHSKEDFNKQNVSFDTNEQGWSNYQGIDFRIVTYPKNNRIAVTF